MKTTFRTLAIVATLLLAACGGKARQVNPPDLPGEEFPSTTNPGPNTAETVVFDPAFKTITIHVTEPVNANRVLSPVSGGIPFARGVLPPEQVPRLVLTDDQKQRIATFQRPVVLGHWNDGSVKWLLLDFLAHVTPGATEDFTLGLADTDTSDDPAIVIEENGDAFTVDTGKLRAVLSKKAFSLIQQAWLDNNSNGTYESDELVVDGAGEMYVDLDVQPPGEADGGATNYPATEYVGMEGGNWLRDSQSGSNQTHYLASAGDYEISLFRRGRTHSIFRLQGWHRNPQTQRQFARYTLYLHFYAMRGFVRLSHTWIMTGDPDKNFIRRMAVELPVTVNNGTLNYTYGGPFENPQPPIIFVQGQLPYQGFIQGPSQEHAGTISGGDRISLASIGPDKYYHNRPPQTDLSVEYTVRRNGNVIHNGTRAAGWQDVNNGIMGISAGIKDFWREHPKEVRYDNGKISVFLWPDEGGKSLDLRRRYPELRGTGTASRRETIAAGSAVGLAKTTEFWFYFHGPADKARVDDEFRSFQDPLRPYANSAHSTSSGVWGNLEPYDPEKYPRMENFLDFSFAWMTRAAEEFSWYGWMDYGDHLIEYEILNAELPHIPSNGGKYANWGYSGWMHESYRFGQFLFIQYLRSGRHFYFRQADSWLKHHRDVDMAHWDTPDDGPRPGDNGGAFRLGGGHRHDQQHWGSYLVGYGIPTIAMGHHYFLTGDGRDLDVLRDTSNWTLNHSTGENHSLLALLYAAEALDDADLTQQVWNRATNINTDTGAVEFTFMPTSGFGRRILESGMGLMLYDIQTGGSGEVRNYLKAWEAGSSTQFPGSYLLGHLEHEENQNTYIASITDRFEIIFPLIDLSGKNISYIPWPQGRIPLDSRDIFSADIINQIGSPLKWPFKSMDKLMYLVHGWNTKTVGSWNISTAIAPNPSRNMYIHQLLWLMSELPPQ